MNRTAVACLHNEQFLSFRYAFLPGSFLPRVPVGLSGVCLLSSAGRMLVGVSFPGQTKKGACRSRGLNLFLNVEEV